MNTTLSTWSRRLAAVSILTMGMLAGGQSAQASDIYWSGSRVGVHTDARVICTTSYKGPGLVSAEPKMGTSAGYELGQNVAWKYTIVNAYTGAAVWADTSWRYARIQTLWYTQDYWGHTTPQTQQYAPLPVMYWDMPRGLYRVQTDYAWWTGVWNYATARTDAYLISQNPVGIRTSNLCSIGVLY
jgi:hypothetical protein